MKSRKNVVVKALFSVDQFVALDEECTDADVSHSELLRELSMEWVRQRQSTKAESQGKWAISGQKMAIPSANSRVNFGVAPVRLRV
jgi:hypothetical protein